MNRARRSQPTSYRSVCVDLGDCLRDRFSEIEKAVYAHVRTISESIEGDDPEYATYVRAAIVELLEQAIASLGQQDDYLNAPLPPAAVEQARRSARKGVSLETLMRCYAAGDRLLGRFIIEEADRFPCEVLWQIIAMQGPRMDLLMASMASEYRYEVDRMRRSPAQRRAEVVERLLASDPLVGFAELEYVMDNWHLGLILAGIEAEAAVREMAISLDRQVLTVPRDNDVVWAWLSGRTELATGEVERYLSSNGPAEVWGVLGEPRHGRAGWKLTHREAQAAWRVCRRPGRLILGRDVMLLAAVLRDDAVADSLRQTYLAPLEEIGDSDMLCGTLRAYFSTGGNTATTATKIGAHRQTVQRRLEKIEEKLNRPLHACHAELQVALNLAIYDKDATF